MVSYLKKQNGSLQHLQRAEPGCWIHVQGPLSADETAELSHQFSIDIDFLTDSLDIDERSRYETEDGMDLIVLKTPLKNEKISDSEAFYITIPIGIIRTAEHVITICGHENPVVSYFLRTPPKNFSTIDPENFILHILERNVHSFQEFLKAINYKRYAFEKELQNSSRNEDLTNLLNIQKSLIYFVTNLRSNDLLMLKMQRSNYLRITDEDKMELLKDIIVDNSQALEMSEMYSNILNGTMDTFASIISNNLNQVMRRLTSVTIVLMIPTLIASFYGMNVDHLPLAHNPYSFVLVFLISILVSTVFTIYFVRKRWF